MGCLFSSPPPYPEFKVTCCLVGRKVDVDTCLEVVSRACEALYKMESVSIQVMHDLADFKFELTDPLHFTEEFAACAAYVRAITSGEARAHYVLNLTNVLRLRVPIPSLSFTLGHAVVNNDVPAAWMDLDVDPVFCYRFVMKALRNAAESTGCELREHDLNVDSEVLARQQNKIARLRGEVGCMCAARRRAEYDGASAVPHIESCTPQEAQGSSLAPVVAMDELHATPSTP
jgi:hypothetical protein